MSVRLPAWNSDLPFTGVKSCDKIQLVKTTFRCPSKDILGSVAELVDHLTQSQDNKSIPVVFNQDFKLDNNKQQ